MALLVHTVRGAGVSVADRTRPFRIGALTVSWGPTPQIVGMRDGLLALGYREEVDFFLGVCFTQGDKHALRAAAHQLVQDGVDLLFVDTNEAALAAQQATTQIPIVFASVADPIGMGLAQSFARPGGNITGVTDFPEERGALASYAPDTFGTGKQAARLVGKILKGTKPADIPVEVNSKIEFVINLKTAKALGLTIAPVVLFQADRIIR
jgi:ABC-type uncharacterized transport system substrate-binding protein